MSRQLPLHWRHNEPDGVSNHHPRDCLLNSLFRCRSKKTSKLRVIGLCAENSPGTSYLENVFIWWRHHGCYIISPIWTRYSINSQYFDYFENKRVKERNGGIWLGNPPPLPRSRNVLSWWRHQMEIFFRATGPLWGNPPAGLWCLEQTIKTPVIFMPSRLLWRYCNVVRMFESFFNKL